MGKAERCRFRVASRRSLCRTGDRRIHDDPAALCVLMQRWDVPEWRIPGGIAAIRRRQLLRRCGKRGADNGVGTVFQLSPDFQTLKTLYTFQPDNNCKHPTGAWPTGLVEGSDGNLYGTTISGGTYDAGVIFRVSKTGDFKLVHSLCPSCGEGADAEFLVKGNDGDFYGDAYGVLFRVTPKGKFKVLHTFDSGTEGPDALGLALASDGNLYGTTLGGTDILTSLFRLKPSGRFDILQSFHYSDFPASAPLQAMDGHLYGVLTHDSDDDDAGLFRSNLSSSRFHVPTL